jgi:glycosyltransferase involved in cell wall biosynthesis
MELQDKNPNLPLFSIITVCYNSEKTILKTMLSVLNQSFQNYEYIVVDGKSSDNTLKLINSAEPKFKGKMRIISEEDKGIYDAMNKGIKLARGKLIGIINSDDWYETDTFASVYKYFLTDSDSIIYGLMRYIRDDKEYQIKSHSHEFLNKDMINHPTCFIPKCIYEKIGLFNLKYKLAADYDLILRCKKEGYKFIHIPKVLANMRMVGGASFKNQYKSRKETYEVQYDHNYISFVYKLLRLAEIRIILIVKSLFSIK